MVKLTEEDEGHAFSNHSFTIKGNNNVTTGMDCVLFKTFFRDTTFVLSKPLDME